DCLIDGDDACGLCANAVLARRIGKIHELPADHTDFCAGRFAADGADLPACSGVAVRRRGASGYGNPESACRIRKRQYRRTADRIVSSTATTLAAFVPMLFWPGVSGKFMSYLPITLIFVLVGSLLMALIFLPVLGSRFGGVAQADTETLKALAASEKGNIAEL